MKKTFRPAIVVAAMLAFGLLLSGCQTLSPQQRSALGTGVGSLVGAVAGSQLGDGNGRLVAMALGAALGGYVGNRFADHLNQQEQESLAQTTRQALMADEGSAGAMDWTSEQRRDVDGQIIYGKAVPAHDSQSVAYLAEVRGESVSSEEQARLASLATGTHCRPTRTSLSVEDRVVADGAIWCRTPEGDYAPLDTLAA
ncbi:surface antigen [Halomonas campaniensis]|uniref:Surface antigen n=1 Tax=Halomonas campaniensis TaxID=213554 RepID=A0A7W5K0M6_9GAMM|nr:glycine zipper 2TM domain-containing protein [Halomonas campaniensis]MBB3329745.1 surface antigen [Halomonas campaniensis]